MAGSAKRRQDQLGTIRRLRDTLEKSPSEYEFMLPPLVSHADDYRAQADRLAHYAATVIPARIMGLLAVTFMKTYHFLDCYLQGIDGHNPFAVLLAARCQMEIFAVTWDVKSILEANQGLNKPGLADRVKIVDEALIQATYGTRLKLVKDFLKMAPGASRLRDVRDSDLGVLEARNVLTRIERVERSGSFKGFRDTYDRLCEYLHPNIGQNIILHTTSERGPGWALLRRSSETADSRAQRATSFVMAESAERTIAAFERGIAPPFGGEPGMVP